MLLRIFKTSQPIFWVFITLIIITLRLILFLFFYQQPILTDFSNPSSIFLNQFSINYPWVSHLISLPIILISGFFFNTLVQNLNLLKGNHSLLVLFFGIFISYSPDNLVLTPFIITLPFLLFSLSLTLIQSKSGVDLKTVFNASFSIGVATIIYFPSVILGLIILLSLAYLNQATWRSFLITLIGMALPWLFYDVSVFYFELNLLNSIAYFGAQFGTFNVTNYGEIYAIGLLTALTLLQSLVYFRVASKSIVKNRKLLFLILYFLLIGIIANGFLITSNFNLLNLTIIPLAIYFTVFQMEEKKWWLQDLVFIGLIGSLVLNYSIIVF